MRSARTVALTLGCLLASSSMVSAQTITPISGGFVLRLGRDTVAMERYERREDRLEGDLLMRVPATARVRYTTEFGKDGRVTRSTARVEPLGSVHGGEPRKITMEFMADSIRMTVDSGALHRVEMRRGAPGVVPLIAGPYATSYATYEWLIGRAHDGDTVQLAVVSPVTARVGTALFIRHSKQRADIDFFGENFMPVSLDAEGRLVAVDANALTVRSNAERVAPMDVGRLSARFAALDRAGTGLGVVSPPDSVRGRVGGVRLAIDYSSPRMRGRPVLGGLVPYGMVWRTGANASTTLQTDGDLMIGGQRLPAGTYSLWSVPFEDHAELILNRQHGQWGTEYDDTKDALHVTMQAATAEAQERFTIRLAPENVLEFRWSTFRWTVPIAQP
ncbi:MAG: DUF2911 domain-containing protein [Gemmatimonadaceae bacterium]